MSTLDLEESWEGETYLNLDFCSVHVRFYISFFDDIFRHLDSYCALNDPFLDVLILYIEGKYVCLPLCELYNHDVLKHLLFPLPVLGFVVPPFRQI